MQDMDREFWHPVRAFLIRYAEYNRERGAPVQQLEEFDHLSARLLSARDLKEAVINRLTSFELKSDYHNLILLTLLQDITKWSQQYYAQLQAHPGPLECLISQSLAVLNAQQQFHTIVPKQNELIALLLPHPHTLQSLDHFKVLYRRLKDVKEFYPAATRDHQKQCFLRAVEECLERAAHTQNIKIVEFIFSNIFNELENLEETHEYVSQRLKIIKKIVKLLWVYHEDILYKVAFLLMRLSYQVLGNRHLFNYVLPIYEHLLVKLIERPSIAPLLVYRHLVFNNISKILTSGGSCVVLQVLLAQLQSIFQQPTLRYFMRHYDWNFLELPICQQSLHLLYDYTENRAHEQRIEFQLAKGCLGRILVLIRSELESAKSAQRDESKWKFYQLKRREFQELLQELNEKPKKVFKRIETISNRDMREAAVGKVVRLIKKTTHLNNRSMIDILASDNSVSAELFSQYVEVVLQQCREHDLEQFMRLFTSNFFLTGESQQIGRVIDTITQLYFSHQDPSARLLRSSDATYTFANAILILNTDLHNPKNEEKISEENFLKMCRKINDNEDLPDEVVKRTYANIKRNKINTFRDRGSMLGISLSNWLIICADTTSLPLAYYDPDLALLDEPALTRFISDVLAGIVDEKETAKLEALVERFVYDDRVFECQIVQTVRRIVEKKPHLPLHILQKVLELGNFRNSKTSEKLLSYYWLAATLCTAFAPLLPTNLITEYILLSWATRADLQDNLYLRQVAQMRRVKQCIRTVTKREAKRSIMDMFSNFLSFKESDDEPEAPPNDYNRRNNFKALSNSVFDILKYSEVHRRPALDFLVAYIHHEEAKQYQEFVSCLFLIFNLLYCMDGCEKTAEDLFYELLGAKESSITKRLANLGKKDAKLYNILNNYCRFWILKLLLKEYSPHKLLTTLNNNYYYLLSKALQHLQQVDKEILHDLLKEITSKPTIHPLIYEAFEKAINKVYPNGNLQEVQFFFDKFKSNQQQNIQEVKNEEKTLEEKPKSEVQDKIVEKRPEEDVDVQKGQQEQQKEEVYPTVKQMEIIKSQSLEQKEQSSIVKQRSIDQLDEYVNPDEEINKVQEEIESHIKARGEEQPLENVPAAAEGKQEEKTEVKMEKKEQTVQQIVKQEQPADSKHEEEAPSLPVVMF